MTDPRTTTGVPQRRIRKSVLLLLRVLRTLLILLIAINVLVYFLQDSLLFHPQKLTTTGVQHIRATNPEMQDIYLTAADGTRLQGWMAKGATGKNGAPILVFCGNGGEVSGLVLETARETGRLVIGVNYRGYGQSGGAPSEKHLLADALLIYDELVRRKMIDRHVVLMGCSLGSGVAVYLAQQRRARSVILITPYDSITRVAQGRYPMVAVPLIIKHRFDSISRAPDIHLPLLALIAGQDQTIPPAHGLCLVRQWGGPVTCSTTRRRPASDPTPSWAASSTASG